VNAHCHLDYTHMAGQLPPPNSFVDWIKAIVEIKAGWTLDDYARSWTDGAQMLLRSGTTTVADIEAMPELLPGVWSSTPLRVISLFEMIGFSNRRPPRTLLKETLARCASLRKQSVLVGLSPHAPYSTVPELLRLAGEAARAERMLVSTHVAESRVESEMFRHANGEMYEWLQHSGREMSDCGLRSPVEHLARARLLARNLLAVHVNYLQRGDAQLLARSGASVVHCPRSHYYFRHAPFPLQTLKRAGINLCLGTDSLATVYKRRAETVTLDMFAEMRRLAESCPLLSPRSILRMATVNGASALGLTNRVGALVKGACADVIARPLRPRETDLYRAAINHEGPVLASMIKGVWAIPPQ